MTREEFRAQAAISALQAVVEAKYGILLEADVDLAATLSIRLANALTEKFMRKTSELRERINSDGYFHKRQRLMLRKMAYCIDSYNLTGNNLYLMEADRFKKKARWYKKAVDLSSIYTVDLDYETYSKLVHILHVNPTLNNRIMCGSILETLFDIKIPNTWLRYDK